MILKSVHVSGFHCYQKATFDIGENFTILIGKNGSGKSSLVKAIKTALSVFFSNNSSWDYSSIVGSVSDLRITNLASSEVWHDNNMKPAGFVQIKADAKCRLSNGISDFPSWSFYKASTSAAKVQSTYYKEAYIYFRKHYTDSSVWPLFMYYSDRYPHIDTNLSNAAKEMIGEENPYRSWAYYHWDHDTSCALIWQERYKRIYKLNFSRHMTYNRIEDKSSGEAKKCKEEIDKYTAELDYVLKYLKMFTSDGIEMLSDNSMSLKITDLIVDEIDEESYIVAYFADGSRRRWDELPAGYERLYNIVFDIAYRSYILNRGIAAPQGIVLIDELDLHLHPSMEQDVLNRLLYTFDEIQFIVTTHSPLVISNTTLKEGGKIILLKNSDNGYESTEYDNLYGLDYDYVLSAVMRTEPRHFKLKELKQKYIRLRSRQNNTKADKTLQDIEALNPDRFEDIKRELEQQLDKM